MPVRTAALIETELAIGVTWSLPFGQSRAAECRGGEGILMNCGGALPSDPELIICELH